MIVTPVRVLQRVQTQLQLQRGSLCDTPAARTCCCAVPCVAVAAGPEHKVTSCPMYSVSEPFQLCRAAEWTILSTARRLRCGRRSSRPASRGAPASRGRWKAAWVRMRAVQCLVHAACGLLQKGRLLQGSRALLPLCQSQRKRSSGISKCRGPTAAVRRCFWPCSCLTPSWHTSQVMRPGP